MIFNDPVNEAFPQGRTTNTYVITDDAGLQKGSHYLQFGFYGKQIRVRSCDASGTTPVYTLAMGAGQPALTTHDLPGIQVDDLANANALLGILGRLRGWL